MTEPTGRLELPTGGLRNRAHTSTVVREGSISEGLMTLVPSTYASVRHVPSHWLHSWMHEDVTSRQLPRRAACRRVDHVKSFGPFHQSTEARAQKVRFAVLRDVHSDESHGATLCHGRRPPSACSGSGGPDLIREHTVRRRPRHPD